MPVHTIVPIATDDLTVWSAVGAATAHECVLTNDGDTTHLDDNDTNDGWVRLTGDASLPFARSINSVTVKSISRAEIAGTPEGTYHHVYIGGTFYLIAFTSPSSSYEERSSSWPTNPATGQPWLRAEVNLPLIWGMKRQNTNGPAQFITQVWLEIDYETEFEIPRGIPSRRVFLFGRPAPRFRKALPLNAALRFDLLDHVTVSQPRGPHVTDPGWGRERWKRRPAIGVEQLIDPNTNEVEWTFRDRSRRRALYFDSAVATISAKSWGEGVQRFSRRDAIVRTFARNSFAYIPSPLDGRIVQIEEDQEKFARDGELLEGQRENLLIESGFKNGAADTYTGWTKTGATGGNTIVDDSAVLYFDSRLVTRSPKLTWAAASGVDLYLLSTATASQVANTKVTVSVAHQDDSGNALYWTLQRSVDGWYWNEAGQAWSSSIVWNPLTVSTTWARHQAGAGIDIGGSAATLTARVGVPNASGVDGQVNHAAHVQIEVGDYMTSLVLTEAASYTRLADSLLISNEWHARSWSNEQGAFACQVLTGWTPAEIGNTNKTVAYVEFDSNDYSWLYYDGTNDRWVFERSRGGNVTRALYSDSPTKGAVVDLVPRWTGAEGELGLTPYTWSLFVRGVKGTDATDSGGPPAEISSCDLELGSKGGAEHFDGQIRRIQSLQYVPLDEEAARLPVR